MTGETVVGEEDPRQQDSEDLQVTEGDPSQDVTKGEETTKRTWDGYR